MEHEEDSHCSTAGTGETGEYTASFPGIKRHEILLNDYVLFLCYPLHYVAQEYMFPLNIVQEGLYLYAVLQLIPPNLNLNLNTTQQLVLGLSQLDSHLTGEPPDLLPE